MNHTFVIAFVAFDLVFTAGLVMYLFRQRGGLAGITLTQQLLTTLYPEIERALQSGWDGQAESLPALLAPFVDRMDSELTGRGFTIGRRTLKAALARRIVRRGLANWRKVDDAMKRVA